MAGQGGLAEEIRTGLEDLPQTPLETIARTDPLDELWFRKPVRQHVREFSVVLGIILLIFAGSAFYHRAIDSGMALTLAAMLLCVIGYRAPRILKPVWEAFIHLGEVLGRIVTFVVLLLTWSIALIPLAIGLKIFGVRVMDMGFRLPVETYWEKRDQSKNDFKFLERQY